MENFISVGQFARRIRDVFGDDPRFRYFFHHIARLGGPNDECITIVSEQDQKEIEAHLWDASGLSRPPGEDETYVCYAAKGNSLVIRSTGRLAKCTVALNDSCNDIGWISENGEISRRPSEISALDSAACRSRLGKPGMPVALSDAAMESRRAGLFA